MYIQLPRYTPKPSRVPVPAPVPTSLCLPVRWLLRAATETRGGAHGTSCSKRLMRAGPLKAKELATLMQVMAASLSINNGRAW